MNAQSNEAGVGASQRVRWQRRRPVVITVVGAMLAVGAFLLWGPIGLGNGPLNAGASGVTGGTDPGGGPLGFIIPIRNSGHAPTVIDGVELIGGTRYADPHLLALGVLTSGICGGAWPARQGARGFVLSGCGGTNRGRLIGHAIGPTHHPRYLEFPAAAEVAAPDPGTCWVMTKIVVHYHVGIRHYSASDPYQLAVCSDAALVDSAMTAAEAAD